MDINRQQTKKYIAVTLVETLLYIALTSAMILVITGSFNSYLKTRTRAIVRTEVDAQAGFIINRINYHLKNSESVSTPVNLGSGTQLNFVANGGTTDMSLAVNGDQLQLTSNGSSIESLTNNRVSISNFQVHNRAPIDNSPIISYSFKVSFKGGDGAEFVYSSEYQSTVVVNSY